MPTLHGGLPQHVVRTHQREEAGAGSRASSLSHQGLCKRIMCFCVMFFYGSVQYLQAGGKNSRYSVSFSLFQRCGFVLIIGLLDPDP
jgi:hypothetical protein